MKTDLSETELEEDVSKTLNKDYQLPRVCLIFNIEQGMEIANIISTACTYLYNQTYLNAELLIISNIGPLPAPGVKFLQDHINSVRYVDNSKGLSDEAILKEYSQAEFSVKIEQSHFKNYTLVHNIVEAQYHSEKKKPSSSD